MKYFISRVIFTSFFQVMVIEFSSEMMSLKKPSKLFVLNIPKGKFSIVIFSDYYIFCNLLALFVCLRGRVERADCQNESSCLAENDKQFQLI